MNQGLLGNCHDGGQPRIVIRGVANTQANHGNWVHSVTLPTTFCTEPDNILYRQHLNSMATRCAQVGFSPIVREISGFSSGIQPRNTVAAMGVASR
jgi:hypothetical protein